MGRVVAVGLGPAGPELMTSAATDAMRNAARRFVRTTRHPAAASLSGAVGRFESFDRHYEGHATFEETYEAIVEDLVAAAREAGRSGGYVAYAVPGSPLVAERTVELLREQSAVGLEVVPAMSFLDLAWDRLRIDPLSQGVKLVDGTRFATDAAGVDGPMLVAQVHSRSVLSDVKLALGDPAADVGVATVAPESVDDVVATAVLLYHLGMADEQVLPVAWPELDRTLEPDHLTSIWIPAMHAPVASELVELDELVRTLRSRCPWDMLQTHRSLGRHLIEEAYETLDAITALSDAEPDPGWERVQHLEEELGDLLFQVYFHALLGAEQGRFTLADVARGVHDKLVSRHPHVFGDATARTPEDVSARWEVIKQQEKGRSSIFEGIPSALPSLALAVKVQRKAEALGVRPLDRADLRGEIGSVLDDLLDRPESSAPAEAAEEAADEVAGEVAGAGADAEVIAQVGETLFLVAELARRRGVDAEAALRARSLAFRDAVEANM